MVNIIIWLWALLGEMNLAVVVKHGNISKACITISLPQVDYATRSQAVTYCSSSELVVEEIGISFSAFASTVLWILHAEHSTLDVFSWSFGNSSLAYRTIILYWWRLIWSMLCCGWFHPRGGGTMPQLPSIQYYHLYWRFSLSCD